MKLNEIRDNLGATHKPKRIGRGIGSGSGKTATRGQKGQHARRQVRPGFEGGQTPLYRRMPKRGFTNPMEKHYAVINLITLQKAIDDGKLDASQPITDKLLREKGLVKGVYDGVRVLAKGEIKSAITIEAHGFSQKAKECIEKVGGTTSLVHKETDSAVKKAKVAQ